MNMVATRADGWYGKTRDGCYGLKLDARAMNDLAMMVFSGATIDADPAVGPLLGVVESNKVMVKSARRGFDMRVTMGIPNFRARCVGGWRYWPDFDAPLREDDRLVRTLRVIDLLQRDQITVCVGKHDEHGRRRLRCYVQPVGMPRMELEQLRF